MKILIVLACLLLSWSQAALGQAILLGSTPAAGAVLEQAPHEIVLAFSAPVHATAIRLTDPRGTPLVVNAGADADSLRIPVPSSVLQGTYVLAWRVATANGRPVGGTLDFSVGTTSTPPARAAQPSSTARDVVIWLSSWLTWLCVLAVAGAALFRAREPGGTQAWARAPLVAGLLLLPVDLALQGLDLLGAPWTALAGIAPWKTALSSIQALSLLLLGLALLAGRQALKDGGPPLRAWAPASVLLAGSGIATGALAAFAAPVWLSRPVLILHVMAIIAWAGSLIPLYRLLSAPAPQPQAPDAALVPLARFSHVIAWVVLLLVLSGVMLARLQLGGPGDLLHTDYGNVLLAKLVLVALLLAVAAYNRWGLTAGVLAGSPQARSRLVRAIGSEIILLAGILSIVTLWRFTPPAGSQAAVAEPPAATLVLEDRRMRALLEHPAGAGPWRVRLITIDGTKLDPRHVTLGLDNPGAGVQPLERTMLEQADGRWRADLPALPAGGQWQVRLAIRIGDFDEITLRRDVDLQPLAAAAPGASTRPRDGSRGDAG